MKDTIKLGLKTKMIAHRGVSGLEPQNTCAAFVAAGNRSYFGIETDVHVTSDGKFVIIHDDSTGNVSKTNICVEKSTYEELKSVCLYSYDGRGGRRDLVIPDLCDYINICKKYEKIAVLEIKNAMTRESIKKIVGEIKDLGYLENTVFISFDFDNLVFVRELSKNQTVQYLVTEYSDELVKKLAEHKMDVDILYKKLTKKQVDVFHDNGIKINVWTVDDEACAKQLSLWGVDYITSNIIE